MEFSQPIESVRDEEGLHFRPSDVEAPRAPAAVFHPVRALILIERLSVKFKETVFVLREIGGDPVEDHADARLVHLFDEIPEILRRSVPGSRGVVSRDLIAPRLVKRMLHHGQQLYMGIAHLCGVRRKTVGDLTIVQIPVPVARRAIVRPPGAEVDFVNIERRGIKMIDLRTESALFGTNRRRTLRQPLCVLPDVSVKRADDGRRLPPCFGGKRVRISFEARDAVPPGHGEFVKAAGQRLVRADGYFPYPFVRNAGHGQAGFPVRKIGNKGCRLGVRRPRPEKSPVFVTLALRMTAEVFVSVKIGSLVKEIRREVFFSGGNRNQDIVHGESLPFPFFIIHDSGKVFKGFCHFCEIFFWKMRTVSASSPKKCAILTAVQRQTQLCSEQGRKQEARFPLLR